MISEVKRIGIRIAATFLVCASAANAHRPFESTAIARLDGEGLELVLTMSAELAGKLIDEPMRSSAAFETFRPQFLKAGAELYEVTSNGKPVLPDRVFFKDHQGEAVFSVIYPVMDSIGLRFRALYLEKLPLGYAGSIELFGETGNVLGREPLLKRGETQEIFFVPPPAPLSAPVSATRLMAPEQSLGTAAPTQTEVAHQRHDLFFPVIGLVLFLRVVWRRQKFCNRKTHLHG